MLFYEAWSVRCNSGQNVTLLGNLFQETSVSQQTQAFRCQQGIVCVRQALHQLSYICRLAQIFYEHRLEVAFTFQSDSCCFGCLCAIPVCLSSADMFMFPWGQNMSLFFCAIQKLQNSAKANPMDNVYYISKTNFRFWYQLIVVWRYSFNITQLFFS